MAKGSKLVVGHTCWESGYVSSSCYILESCPAVDDLTVHSVNTVVISNCTKKEVDYEQRRHVDLSSVLVFGGG